MDKVSEANIGVPKKYIELRPKSFTRTGVPGDVMNVWCCLALEISAADMPLRGQQTAERRTEHLKQILNTPLLTYEEYAEDKYSPASRAAMSTRLQIETVLAFNALVNEYNQLAINGQVTPQIAKDFLRRAEEVVRTDT